MGIGIRILPGLRISASSRGIRAGVGPRLARVHVGSGGLGLSTGAGPVTAYTGAMGGRGSGRRSLTAYERDVRRLEREQQFEQALALEEQLLSVHREHFAPAQPPEAPAVKPVDLRALEREHVRRAVRGISWFKRAERRAAKHSAREQAAGAAARQGQERIYERERHQARLDEEWKNLNENDPETVVAALEAAFADNAAPAAPLDCRGSRVTVTVVYGPSSLIPEHRPERTPTGRPSLKRRTQTERNALYAASLASHVLATAKEAFAVAPSIDEVLILAVRKESGPTAEQLIAIYCGTFQREGLDSVRWDDEYVLGHASAANEVLFETRGRTKELTALDLDGEPELQRVLDKMARSLGVQAPTARKARRSKPASQRSRRSSGGAASRPRRRSARSTRSPQSDRIAAAIEALGEPDARKRREAAQVLAASADRRARTPLIGALRDLDVTVRWHAASALARNGDGDRHVLQAVGEALADPEPKIRALAATALGQLGDGSSSRKLAEALEDPDADVRAAAARALAQTGDRGS